MIVNNSFNFYRSTCLGLNWLFSIFCVLLYKVICIQLITSIFLLITAQRMRVAREIIETERKYCSVLWTVLDHFALSLRDCGYLSSQDIW